MKINPKGFCDAEKYMVNEVNTTQVENDNQLDNK